jgi:outer membrane biosynthesis protein TonB
MELNDIIALVKAGFTHDEIKAMEQAPVQPNAVPVSEPTPAPAPVAEPEPAPVAEPVAVPQPTPTQAPAPAPAEPTMAELMQSIAKLTSAVQANAIAQSVIPGVGNPQTPTAEDMLAEIIRPTFKERNQ